MKKISAKSKSRSRNDSISDEDRIDEVKSGGDHVASPAFVHLGNVGVKLENEGHVGGPGGLLDTVEEVVEAPWEEIPEPDLSQGYVVDLTQQFNRIFVQTTFNSFKEFEKLFNKFKAETGSVFRIKSSCSIAYENSRRKKHLIPSRFKFVTVRYCCVHYGQPKVAGQGIRTKQRYLPCGCESMLSVSYNRGSLVISQANMRHNHDVSSEMAPFYAINRRISNAELREVAGVVEMIPSSRALQHFLQIHFRRPTTLQDAKNVRARLKALKVPQAVATRLPSSEESGTALFEDEEEDEEEGEQDEEDTVMDSIDGVDFKVQEEVVSSRVGNSEYDYWGKVSTCTSAKRQQYRQQNQKEEEEEEEVIGDGEKEKQKPEIDPGMRREVLSEIKTRLFNVMESCNSRVFHERVSVIERLIEGWENGNPVHIQYVEESDFEARAVESVNAHDINTNLPQERMKSENDRNANSYSLIDSLNVALPALGMKERSQFFPPQVTKKSADMDHKNQPKISGVMETTNGNSSVTKFNYGCGNSSQHYKTITQCSMGINKSKISERRPIILSIVKGFVGGCDQPVEVEIEVDGEVARVKAVKREPLDYYEVNVGD